VSAPGQVGQEGFDLRLGGKEGCPGAHAVETEETHDPLHVGSLGVNGVRVEPLAHLIEAFGWLTSGYVRPIFFSWWGCEIADNRYRSKLPENPINIIIKAKTQVNQWFAPLRGAYARAEQVVREVWG